MPAHVLVRTHKIPYRDALRKTGYQRRPQEPRINKLMSQLRKNRVDVPTSILLNVRGAQARHLLFEEGGQLFLRIDENNADDIAFYVVDGQHRVLAVAKLCTDEPEKWSEFALQFVLLLGATEEEEMNQFFVVNSTAKSVKTDLAIDLLKQRADADGRVMEDVIESGQQWKVVGQSIVERLHKESTIWRARIRLANAEKGDSIIPAASFVNSLKNLHGHGYFSALSLDQQVRLLDAYWSGIRRACREPFDGEIEDYTLQKGIGVTAMHELLPLVIEHIRSSGGSVFDVDAYAKLMAPVLSELSGENKDSEPVSGGDFWRTAPLGGAAGSYSSSAGKRVLVAKLKALLPEMEVE